jgi:hypothetical protein
LTTDKRLDGLLGLQVEEENTMQTETARRLNILGSDHKSDQEIFNSVLKRWRQRLVCCSIFAAVPAILVAPFSEARSDEPKRSQDNITGRWPTVRNALNLNATNPALLKRQSEFRLPHQIDVLTTVGGNDDCPGASIPGGTYTAAAPYIDSGDTTGASNTINSLQYYYYYSYNAFGPDHIYSFTLTSRGPNPQIQVSTTSSTYRPLIYVLYGGYAGACPTGTGNTGYPYASAEAPAPGGTATIFIQHLPLNVPFHLFVDSTSSGAGPYTLRMQDVTISPSTCTNPIDCPEFFVYEHYLDFLSRQPETGGQSYWTNEITGCGADAACIHRRRIGVSAAFFVETEFQETGYYVYRFYKATFGRQPTYQEFSSDRYRVVEGPNRESSKQRFADDWVQRSLFLASYPVTMSNTEFVNRVFDSAGLTAAIYNPLRQQEIQAMNGGRSRALILRDVIEIPDFRNIPDPNDPRFNELKQVSQYNPAFVLMQYFAYLHRNVDIDGYLFWLDVVNNREPNNYSGMVCAFLTSAEYQRRFGSAVTRTNADCGP